MDRLKYRMITFVDDNRSTMQGHTERSSTAAVIFGERAMKTLPLGVTAGPAPYAQGGCGLDLRNQVR
jgi:hypothetical protein